MDGNKQSLGTRVLVVGPSAAGKTRFAKLLGQVLPVPLIHMDSIMWRPGWQYVGDQETCRRLLAEAVKEAWIIEGYTPKCTPELMKHATSVIFLEYPKWLVVSRHLQRWLKHRVTPRPEIPGCPERFNKNLLAAYDGEVELIHKYLADAHPDLFIVRLPYPGIATKFILQLAKE